MVPVRKFPVRVTYHFLSPKAPDEPLSFCPTTQLGGPWLPLKTFQLFFESLVTLPNLIFFFLHSSETLVRSSTLEKRRRDRRRLKKTHSHVQSTSFPSGSLSKVHLPTHGSSFSPVKQCSCF